MSDFKVEADFFFTTEVPTDSLLESLQTTFQHYSERKVRNLTFAMKSADVLDVSFVVPAANTDVETMEVSKRFLDELAEKVKELLSHLDSDTSIEDDSLLLMPA